MIVPPNIQQPYYFQHIQRRGVAMLLVLISLFMATILAGAYVASRDNSALIGENIASAAEARWASESALEIAVAALETNVDWPSRLNGTTMLESFEIEGADVSVKVVDTETGEAPTLDSLSIYIIATATKNGLEQVSTALATITPTGVMDVDLSEFAIFASEKMYLDDDSIVTRWPMTTTGARRIKLGTRAMNAAMVELKTNAAAVDTTLYHASAASNDIILNQNSPDLDKKSMQDSIPMPKAPSPGFASDDAGLRSPADIALDITLPDGTRRFTDFRLREGNTVTLTGAVTLVSDTNVRLDNNSSLLIDGDAKLVFLKDVVLTSGSSIELTPGSTLKMYIGGDIDATDAYIGDQREDSDRDNTGYESATDLDSIVVYSVDDLPEKSWLLQSRSVFKAAIYAPTSVIELKNNSALYGRIAAKSVKLIDNSAVFYDPRLDDRAGYSNLKSLVYDADGRILHDVLNLTSLDEIELTTLASKWGLNVVDDGVSKTVALLGGADSDTMPVTEPTPRTRTVTITIERIGAKMAWETDSASQRVKGAVVDAERFGT